jgi:hypothetical protein
MGEPIMNEFQQLIDLLRTAVAEGHTFTLTADDITVKVDGQLTEVTINNPSVATES